MKYRLIKMDLAGGETAVPGIFDSQLDAEEEAEDLMLAEQYDFVSRSEWERNRSFWRVEVFEE
jgi:hypothetical protein